MTRHKFHQLDVFTRTPLTGNPLAVFPDAAGIDANTMQRLAREMNLSETTFVLPSETATRKIRFFTPAAEIPLAGHPTIGTWWLLAELGGLDLPDTGQTDVTQETGRGVLPVRIRTANGRPERVVMQQATPEYGTIVEDPSTLAQQLGGDPGIISASPPPEVVSTALPQLMVPIASLAALKQLPSGGAGAGLSEYLRTLGTDCAMCYSIETEAAEATVHCRMFAPGLGVPEDPATGSAAGALGAYLVRHGVVPAEDSSVEIAVEQGIELGRPSRIEVTIEVSATGAIAAVRVGGAAVSIIEGEVQL